MIGSEVNFAELLAPTDTAPNIRRYLGGAWSMHLAFASDLVRELQPRILVELGVYKGESYFGFCQSVEENKLTTLCYGVDTWQGDPQTGMYGPEIGQEVEAYNVRYSRFSRLLKMTFKDASSQFGAGSIDLLHIDGAHRYEDVKEDFETWLSKVSDRGIILFHDVMVRNRGFGVWRLWLKIAPTQPSFVFEFGHGLGVWKKNAVSEDDPPFIRKLFSATGREREEIVRHYAIAAAAIDLKAKATKPSRATSRVQVFAPRYGAYTENHSNTAEIPIGAWHRVRVDLPWSLGDGSGGLRLDLGNEVAIIDIAGILLQSKLTGKVVWRARGPAELSNLAVGGTAIALPDERLFRIFSFGEDPQVIIPRLSGPEFAVPLRLEAWVHFERSVQAIGRAMAAFYRQVQEENKSNQDKIEQERFVLEAKLRQVSRVQVFAPRYGAYTENHSSMAEIPIGAWHRVRVDLPWSLGDGSGGLRLDLGNEVAIIDIAGILLQSKLTGKVVWRARGPAELSNLAVGGTAIALPDERLFRIFSFGEDPQVIIPRLSGPEFAVPLRLEAWVHFERSVQAIGRAMAAFYRQVQEENKSNQDKIEQERFVLEAKLRQVQEENKSNQDKIEQERFVLEAKLRQVQEENKSKQDKIAALISENQTMERALAAAHSDSEAMRKELSALRPELESIQRQAWDYKAYRADLTTRFKDRDRRIQEIERSLAWKITKPFWKLERHFKRTPEQIAAAGQLVFALDGPGTWNASYDVFTLKGWCYSSRGPQIVGVRAKVGRKSYFARYGIKREPVAQTAPNHPPAIHSGFSVDVPVPEGTSSIRLEAIAQGSRWECFLEHPVPPRTDQPQVPARGDGSVQSAGAEPVNLKDGEYRLTPPVLFPGAGWDQVLPALAPLIEQHSNKVTAANPYFTVITPVFNTLPRWLAEAGASLLSQTFPDWEWCVVDDGSSDQNLRQSLEALGAAHPRFRIKFSTHGGISSACNQGLDLARGKFVCFLDHDDVLDLEALGAMADKLSEGFDLVYSDEDKLDDQQQKLIAPFFKPDWSPEYFRGAMYVGHLLCVSRELADRVRFDSDFDGVQDFEFVLRLTETGARVGHIPRVLYHWRKSPNSIAEASDAKPHITTLQQKAVNAHLERLGLAARAEPGETPHRLKVLPLPRKSFPLISIIIPTKDSPELLSQCLDSIYQNTTYPRFEVILVDNDTTNSEALAVMRRHPVIRLYMPNPFNFSRANNLGARHARGEYLVCLNNDTEVVTPDWLDHLLYFAEQADVGAVGALLVYAHDAVQHAGVVLGMRGTADHVMRGFGPKVDGYAGALSCAREVSAVTGACMLIRRSLFNEVGGFNEHFFTIYQDLDLCLRLRERGFRIICAPRAKLIHHESVSRKKYYDLVDRFLLLDQWQDAIERGDPYYNPNLNLERGDYTLQSKEA